MLYKRHQNESTRPSVASSLSCFMYSTARSAWSDMCRAFSTKMPVKMLNTAMVKKAI